MPRSVMSASEVIESIDRHFAAGCPAIDGGQYREHERTGTCPECRQRALQADSWDELAARVAAHQAGHGCGAAG